MALQNRVTPLGQLIATLERGLVYSNRRESTRRHAYRVAISYDDRVSAESNLRVRALLPDERPWLERQLARLWGSPHVVSRGHLHDASSLPALVCLDRHDPVGFATFDVRRQQCELVTLDAFVDGHGIGSALLDAVAEEARRQGCGRLWLITTNDNLRALRFYQRRGLRLVAVHRGAVDDARRVKPSIPLVGEHGIPIHDELELELDLELALD